MIRRITLMLVIALMATAASAQTKLNGAGATFPYPMYSKWFSEYNKLHPNVQINYQSIGSGGGIRQVTAGTVDFGATDGPMTDQQLTDSKTKIYHIPTVLGAVVPAYNLKDYKGAELKFSGPLLANIFLGRISNWSDAAIAKENPGVTLPNVPIVVVHRSDGSGTTFVWTDYLAKISAEWQNNVGKGNSVRWPLGLGAKGNEGVAGMVKQMDGAIGYIELIYAEQNKITFGSVKNAAGEYVRASLETTSKAAATAKVPNDFRVSITNAPGKGVYPVASFTWLLVPEKNADATKQKVIKEFLNWMVTDGQKLTQQLTYAPLPAEVATRVKAAIGQLK
ncbi:MAG: phosphate ABC transporter substrate-binding protein PstS [Terriglobales bacterium]